MAKKLSARSVRRADAYDALRSAVSLAEHEPDALEALNGPAMRSLIGAKSRGLTAAYVSNMQSRLVGELRQAEMQATADWIISSVRTRFGSAEAKVRRGRVIEVWLDGLPPEVQE